jgi:hypothetical protein
MVNKFQNNEDGGSILRRNVGNDSPGDTVSQHQKTGVLRFIFVFVTDSQVFELQFWREVCHSVNVTSDRSDQSDSRKGVFVLTL